MAELQGLPHCQPLEKRCRIVPWAEAWPVTTALHRGWLRWAADAASADTLNLQSFPRIELKACQQLSYMHQYSVKT